MKIGVSARKTGEDPTCGFCREQVAGSEALGLCPACGVTFHDACRVELTRCPTPGCVGLDTEAFAAAARAEEEAARRARREAARARREEEDAIAGRARAALEEVAAAHVANAATDAATSDRPAGGRPTSAGADAGSKAITRPKPEDLFLGAFAGTGVGLISGLGLTLLGTIAEVGWALLLRRSYSATGAAFFAAPLWALAGALAGACAAAIAAQGRGAAAETSTAVPDPSVTPWRPRLDLLLYLAAATTCLPTLLTAILGAALVPLLVLPRAMSAQGRSSLEGARRRQGPPDPSEPP